MPDGTAARTETPHPRRRMIEYESRLGANVVPTRPPAEVPLGLGALWSKSACEPGCGPLNPRSLGGCCEQHPMTPSKVLVLIIYGLSLRSQAGCSLSAQHRLQRDHIVGERI